MNGACIGSQNAFFYEYNKLFVSFLRQGFQNVVAWHRKDFETPKNMVFFEKRFGVQSSQSTIGKKKKSVVGGSVVEVVADAGYHDAQLLMGRHDGWHERGGKYVDARLEDTHGVFPVVERNITVTISHCQYPMSEAVVVDLELTEEVHVHETHVH